MLCFFCSEVSFLVILCKHKKSINDGVEFSVRLSSVPDVWIPINYTYVQKGGSECPIFKLRGFNVQPTCVKNKKKSLKVIVKICNLTFTDSIQFRWLQTSEEHKSKEKAMWILDDVTIRLNDTTLLNDTFDATMLK